MIVKHSSDETPKPMPVGLRLARVVSIGNGTVDVCPIGSSVVLHDIPVTSATTMQVGDVINLQMMDNKRFAFAQQNVTSASEPATTTVSVASSAASGGAGGGGSAGTLTVGSGLSIDPISAGNLGGNISLVLDSSVARSSWSVNAGSGLTGGGFLSPSGITLNVGQGDGIAVSGDVVAVDGTVVRITRQIIAGNGLSGTSSLASDVTLNIGSGNGIQVLSDSIAVDLASPSGLEFSGGKLQINDLVAGDGIAVANKVFSVPTATTIANGAPAFQGLQTEANGLRLYASHDPGASSHLLASDGTGKLTLPLFRASTNFSSPLYISENGEGLTVRSGTSISLDPGNNQVLLLANKVLQSDGYASQTTGMRITHSGEGDFRYLYSDELHAKSFIADLEQALAGGQIITKSVAVLAADFTLPSAGISNTFVINDLPSAAGMRAFEDGDFVGFRQFDRGSGGLRIAWAWGQVTGYTNLNNGTQQWTFTRSASSPGIASGEIKKDALVLDFGKTGNGYYEVNAIDGLQGANSPYAQIATWATSPSNRTVRTRLGNLRGIFGVSGNSVYTLTISNATGGNFVLWVGEANTGNVAFNASAAALQTAIRTISGLSAATATGTVGSYTITIPSTAAERSLFLDDGGLTGGSNLSTNLVLSSQTNEEYGLYAGNGSGVTNRYVRASNTDVELRNVPLRLYDGANETAQISAGSGNNKPFFAMGSPLPTGPLSNDNGIWMGADGSSPYTYKFRVGNVSGGSLSQGILWDGSSLAVKGAIEVTATSTVGAQIGIIPGQDPYISIGDTTYLTSVLQNGNGIWMGESGGVAQIRIGSVVSGALSAGVHWNGSTLNVRGAITALSGRIEGVLDIGTTGGIYQGTGSFASPTTGLKIWNESSVGRIGGYNNGTLQWSSDTNGRITAGAGKILISSSGVSIEAQTSAYTIDQRAIRWRTASGAIEFAGVFGVEESGQRAVVLGSTQFSFNSIYGMVRAGYTPNVAGSQYVVQEVGDVNNNGVTGSPYGKTTLTTTAFSVSGGLNVGSASGATAGQIRASGASFSGASYLTGGIDVGSIYMDYTPTTGNWGAGGGTTLLLNASTYTTIGFHDTGSRVDFIRAGVGVINVGYNGGWGTANLRANGVFQLANAGRPDTSRYADSRALMLIGASDTAEAWLIGMNGSDTRASVNSQLHLYSYHIGRSMVVLDHTVSGGRIQLNGQLVSDTVTSGWTDFGVVFGSGWANYEGTDSGTWSWFRYKKFGDVIMLRGLVKRASGTGSTVLTLPDNSLFIRPGRQLLLACMSSGGITRVDISTAGVVTVVGPPGTLDWLSFFGVVYSSVA